MARRVRGPSAAGALVAAVLALATAEAHAVSARLAFEQANAQLNGGDGYKTADNATGTLAWGESYILMAYLEMWRATGEVVWLDRLADHADHVLTSRDDARGVTDFAGTSGACWQSSSYGGDKPYCWVVHSGMITWPMAAFAVEVQQDPALWGHLTWDGATLLDKASSFVAAVEQTVARHQFQWAKVAPDQGTYVGDPAATFTSVAGKVLPLNQQNAMGRTLLALWEATGKVQYLDQAQRLGKYLRAQMVLQPSGALVWNYWGGTFAAPGEDISHAAINVSFAVELHRLGLVFTDADMRALGRTFFENVYKGEDTYADHVGGTAGVNGSSYKAQVGRWVDLCRWAPAAWTAVRRTYDAIGTKVSSGSILLGWAKLARWEPVLVPHSFYVVDWEDHGAYSKATAYGANVLALPPAPLARAAVPFSYRAAGPVVVEQWDGGAYHPVAKLPAASSWRDVLLPYDPAIWFPYSGGKILYQLTDAFVAGQGIEVKAPATGQPPAIAPSGGATHDGEPWSVVLGGSGAQPWRWALVAGPAGATLDAGSGLLAWTPPAGAAGEAAFTVALENDWGVAQQDVALTVLPADGDGDGWPWTSDCDDADPHTRPGAIDFCDGADNDCDGQADEGCTMVEGLVFADAGGDGDPTGDAGIAGVPLVLLSHGTIVEATVSGPDGTFVLGPTRRRHLAVKARDLTKKGHPPTTPLLVPIVAPPGSAVTGVHFGVAP